MTSIVSIWPFWRLKVPPFTVNATLSKYLSPADSWDVSFPICIVPLFKDSSEFDTVLLNIMLPKFEAVIFIVPLLPVILSLNVIELVLSAVKFNVPPSLWTSVELPENTTAVELSAEILTVPSL